MCVGVCVCVFVCVSVLLFAEYIKHLDESCSDRRIAEGLFCFLSKKKRKIYAETIQSVAKEFILFDL